MDDEVEHLIENFRELRAGLPTLLDALEELTGTAYAVRGPAAVGAYRDHPDFVRLMPHDGSGGRSSPSPPTDLRPSAEAPTKPGRLKLELPEANL